MCCANFVVLWLVFCCVVLILLCCGDSVVLCTTGPLYILTPESENFLSSEVIQGS